VAGASVQLKEEEVREVVGVGEVVVLAIKRLHAKGLPGGLTRSVTPRPMRCGKRARNDMILQVVIGPMNRIYCHATIVCGHSSCVCREHTQRFPQCTVGHDAAHMKHVMCLPNILPHPALCALSVVPRRNYFQRFRMPSSRSRPCTDRPRLRKPAR